MALYKFTNGTVANANEVNANINKSLSLPILNRINQIQDRSVTLSLGADDIFADAYIDSDGRQNSVTTANTTALFATSRTSISQAYFIDNFTEGSTTETETESGYDGTDQNWGFGITCNKSCFITRITLIATGSGTVNITIQRSGVTVASKTGYSISSGTNNIDFTFSDYDNDEIPLAGEAYQVNYIQVSGSPFVYRKNSKTFSGTLMSNGSSQVFPGNGGGVTVKEVVGATSATNVIEHAIPSGTFSSTVSSLIGKAKINSTEGDAKIEHRLENASENSGWISDGELGSFTAFTSEPTKYIVRLTSKSTGTPTPGIPSVKGSGVYSE